MNFEESANLIDTLAQKLKERSLFMCTAESCTGGLIAAMCTSRAGSSEWFNGGITSYSNDMKQRLLGVPADVLEAHGAVSIATVEHMARGALAACAAQCSIAVSGVAGPGGGSAEKPVGTVCIAVALEAGGNTGAQPLNQTSDPARNQTFMPVLSQTSSLASHTFSFNGTRDEIRCAAAIKGLEMLMRLLN